MTQKLFILSPAVVFAARVNQASFTYDINQVTFDGVTTGAYTDIKPGMTVLFGTAAGSDNRGRQRIRKAATSTILYIGRSSQGTPDGQVNLSDNNYITVLNDRRVWSVIPDIDDDGTIYKDSDIAYTDQTDEIPPKANIFGNARAQTINGGGVISLRLNGSASIAVADGATLSSYSWDVDDGTITSGAGTSIIEADFPAGFRYVALTVTDSNGKSHTTEVPVYAHDPDDSQCVAFQCTSHRITPSGQQCSFRILEDIPLSTHPDGTLVIFWDGEPANIDDYSNVEFWGWVQSEQNSLTAERTATLKDVTLNCVDIAGRLATLPGFSQSIAGNSAPSSWLEMSNPNMDKFIDYLLRWHSTAFEVGLYRPSATGGTYPFVVLKSLGENLWEQAAGMAKALVPDYHLTSNRNGELWVWPDPMLQDSGDRTGTVQAALNEDDYTAVNWERMRPPRVHWIRGEAILASLDVISAVFCTAPGIAPGQGEVSQPSGRQLAASQDDLNSCEGHRYARANAVNGLIPVTMVTDLRIEPANMDWVTFTLNSSYTRRQLGFSTARCLPVEVNISYNYARTGLTKTVELLLEQETSGTAAVTYIPPDTDWEPPYVPPIDPPDPVPDPTNEGDGLGTFYSMTGTVLGRTRDLSASSPSYSAIKSAGAGEDFYDFILDPFNPTTTGFLMSELGVYRSTNLDQVSPSFTLIYDVADMETEVSAVGALSGFYKIVGTIKRNGFFAFGVWEDNASTSCKVHVFVTEDTGDTWTAYTAYSTTGSGSQTRSQFAGAIDIVPSVLSGSGDPVIGVACGRDDKARFLLSEDGGPNWSAGAVDFTGNEYPVDVHFPYNDNAAYSKVLVSCNTTGTAVYTYYISTDGGDTFSPVTTSDLINRVQFKRTPFQSWTQDRQELYALGKDGANLSRKFYRSSDFGGNWASVHTFANGVRAAGGFPYNEGQFYVMTTAGIWLTIDGGSNWLNKTGNWSWGFSFIEPAGGVVVPVWVQE